MTSSITAEPARGTVVYVPRMPALRALWLVPVTILIALAAVTTVGGVLIVRRPGSARRALLGRVLARTAMLLGPTYIKAGQILSSRADLVSTEIATALGVLRQHVRPVASHRIRRVIDSSLSGRGQQLAALDPVPLGAGSVAQVHRARLVDGRVVAVKALRPDIRDRLVFDLAIMRRMASVGVHMPWLRDLPVRAAIDELARLLVRQVDLAQEAAFHMSIAMTFADDPGVHVPALIPGLCTRDVLVMELIEEFGDSAEGAELDECIRIGLRAIYRMLFREGLVHGDMHAGNVAFQRGPRFTMLDFGLAADLTDERRRDFTRFFLGMATNDGKACSRILLDTAVARRASFDATRFEQRMCELIARHSGLRAQDFEVSRFVADLFELQRTNGLIGSTEFMGCILSLLVYEGRVKERYPELDFQAEARSYILSAPQRLM